MGWRGVAVSVLVAWAVAGCGGVRRGVAGGDVTGTRGFDPFPECLVDRAGPL